MTLSSRAASPPRGERPGRYRPGRCPCRVALFTQELGIAVAISAFCLEVAFPLQELLPWLKLPSSANRADADTALGRQGNALPRLFHEGALERVYGQYRPVRGFDGRVEFASARMHSLTAGNQIATNCLPGRVSASHHEVIRPTVDSRRAEAVGQSESRQHLRHA